MDETLTRLIVGGRELRRDIDDEKYTHIKNNNNNNNNNSIICIITYFIVYLDSGYSQGAIWGKRGNLLVTAWF